MDAWEVELGAVGRVSPEYEGSDEFEFDALPYFHLTWRETLIVTARDGGPGVYVQNHWGNDFSAKLGVRYEGDRDEDDSDALKGLGDLDIGAVGVAAIAYETGPIEFSAEVAHDLGGDREGTTATVGAEYAKMAFNNRGRWALGVSLTWADDDYMQNSFGISGTQAVSSRNDYSPFDAASGLKDAAISASYNHAVSDHVSVLAIAKYSRLLGDAADSPLVDDEGDANQFQGVLGLAYRW